MNLDRIDIIMSIILGCILAAIVIYLARGVSFN